MRRKLSESPGFRPTFKEVPAGILKPFDELSLIVSLNVTIRASGNSCWTEIDPAGVVLVL